MIQDEMIMKIGELEREISLLPQGSLTKKNINGKDYYYHRQTINGKRKEKYVRFEDVVYLTQQINKRKELEERLKEYKEKVPASKKIDNRKYKFKTLVRLGKQLQSQIKYVKKYKKREIISELRNYIFSDLNEKVFILYGLRRTGKTTMIRQILLELPEIEMNKAAFIQIQSHDTLEDIDDDLRILEEEGYRYIFIDEVTLMDDFIEGAALFSDIYASSGMKIVLSGNDSLGFAFSKEEQLYDRCIMLHTTFIPYREFEKVLGIKGIDEYIRHGGTMSLGGINYNDAPFASLKNANEYIDTAIAKNIQHSLSLYEYGGHFRGLLDLYEKGELTNVINRVVENINHRFTRYVIEKTFQSHDISVTSRNLLRDRVHPVKLKEHLDLDIVTSGIMKMLDILDIQDQTISVLDTHMKQIKDYLKLLDLVVDIDIEYLPNVAEKGELTVIAQPGMRYAQASVIMENMLLDQKFQEFTPGQRQYVLDRLLSEISGRMMEEIVLLETKIACQDKRVFKLQFPTGEFDMVVYDSKKLTLDIYEIKYSKEVVEQQYRHLIDDEKCAMASHRYGTITGRYVIYRGENKKENNVTYLNVEDYLKSLSQK